MEDTLGAPRTSGRTGGAATATDDGGQREPLVESALRYAEDRHWEVAAGTWLIEENASSRCSCGDPRCSYPGAHPTGPDWAATATAGPGVIRRAWAAQPTASILLPTGRAFDAIDVPEVAGCLALARMERMGVRLGPVLAVPGSGPAGRGRRLLFLVLPGSLPSLPETLRKLGWGTGRLDLIGRGEGSWVVAPPTRVGAFGFAQWAREPNALNRWLPEAGELLSPIAYACGREAPLAPVPDF